jgi:hypothetical protein
MMPRGLLKGDGRLSSRWFGGAGLWFLFHFVSAWRFLGWAFCDIHSFIREVFRKVASADSEGGIEGHWRSLLRGVLFCYL